MRNFDIESFLGEPVRVGGDRPGCPILQDAAVDIQKQPGELYFDDMTNPRRAWMAFGIRDADGSYDDERLIQTDDADIAAGDRRASVLNEYIATPPTPGSARYVRRFSIGYGAARGRSTGNAGL